MHQTKEKKHGFTFIEVIIALAVFSIGVIAVLNLIMNNLNTLDKVQTKITATILAKEGLELAYNIRDTNLQKLFAWDCILADHINTENELDTLTEDVCISHFSSGFDGKILQLAFNPQRYYFAKAVDMGSGFSELFEKNKLYYFTGENIFWYGYAQDTGSGVPTSFARYLIFTGLHDQGNMLPQNNILKIESHVLYQRGGYQGDVVLESIIGNY